MKARAMSGIRRGSVRAAAAIAEATSVSSVYERRNEDRDDRVDRLACGERRDRAGIFVPRCGRGDHVDRVPDGGLGREERPQRGADALGELWHVEAARFARVGAEDRGSTGVGHDPTREDPPAAAASRTARRRRGARRASRCGPPRSAGTVRRPSRRTPRRARRCARRSPARRRPSGRSSPRGSVSCGRSRATDERTCAGFPKDSR